MPPVAPAQNMRIGIDLGGTKIEGLLLDCKGVELARRRIAAPNHNYQATLDTVADLVDLLRSNVTHATETVTVGVGMPGSISPTTDVVQNANSTWLNGQPFHKDLAAALDLPLRTANDANCFALSEAIDGAATNAACVFGVILGTGVGGGLIHRGSILDGPRATGGEWGHNPLPWPNASEYPGPECWCGRRGCLETWASGPGMAADHQRVTGESLTAKEIATRAGVGELAATATLERHASRLARGLAHVANIIDPDVIVLGGGLSQMKHLYDVLPNLIAGHLFADTTTIEIRPPKWGDASGARGAAWLWDLEKEQNR
ncbi:fructokinase [Filomicrobium insigne]|uniref:Fructokinase n=1 Tax=Filomicrobium insigne TaxID=418854 RepID=A0A1H0LCE4_9HYPH|nr:ROK family protein [Filomicrobium insigne]SDO65716.1 fructokinase [Filomicrobium insigne]